MTETLEQIIARVPHVRYEVKNCVDVDPAGNTYEVEEVHSKTCPRCALEAQLARLRVVVREWGETCKRGLDAASNYADTDAQRESFVGRAGVYEKCADELDAILGRKE